MKLIPLIGFKGIFGHRQKKKEKKKGWGRVCGDGGGGGWYPFTQSCRCRGGCDLSAQEVNSVNFLTEWGEDRGGHWQPTIPFLSPSASLFSPFFSPWCCRQTLFFRTAMSCAANDRAPILLWICSKVCFELSEVWWREKTLWLQNDPWVNKEE